MRSARSTKKEADSPQKTAPLGFPPLTVSREALLRDGSDRAFRALVDQMLGFGAELQKARQSLAKALGVTPPQYRILMAIARHAGPGAISVSAVAEALGVSLPFVVKQVGLLVDSGRLLKRTDASDRRRVHLFLTRQSVAAITRLSPRQVGVNDTLFGSLSRTDVGTLTRLFAGLLASAKKLEL